MMPATRAGGETAGQDAVPEIHAPSAGINPRIAWIVYALLLATAVSLWFIAVRSPLWQDETGTYWEISGGFSQIWARQYISFPAYFYIVWLCTKVLGISEIALRVPSIAAMLAAAWLMYRIGREVFNREFGLTAAILFCVNPIVIFAAIDVRPYAFAVLATNGAMLALLCLRRTESGKMAAAFGALAALVVWFHFLFAVILPAFVIVYWLLKRADEKVSWRQFGIAAAWFMALFLAALPGLRFLFRTGGSHVFEKAPELAALGWTLAPDWVGPVFGLTALLALLAAGVKLRSEERVHIARWQIVACLTLGLLPVAILFGVSVETPLHLFVERHRLVAVPGIALCWACLLTLIPYRVLRLGFCLVLVGLTARTYLTEPSLREHMYSWKPAFDVVERNASADGAPVLMCSDFPEADSANLPEITGTKGSRFFAPLSYYKLSVPVYGLPRSLNDEAKARTSVFVRDAEERRERFLAMAFEPSYPTLDWITRIEGGSYVVRTVGIYDHVKVLEFDLRSDGLRTPAAGSAK